MTDVRSSLLSTPPEAIRCPPIASTGQHTVPGAFIQPTETASDRETFGTQFGLRQIRVDPGFGGVYGDIRLVAAIQ